MAYKKKKLFKTRLDLAQEQMDNAVYVVEDEKGNKVSNTSKSVSGRNVYTKGAQSTLNDIAPVKTTSKPTTNVSKGSNIELPSLSLLPDNKINKSNPMDLLTTNNNTLSVTDKILGVNAPTTTNTSDLTSLSKTDLLEKKKELLEQIRNYDRKEKREWWDKDDNILENVGNVLYKAFLEQQDSKYVEDKTYNSLVKQLKDVEDLIENKTLEEQEYSDGFMGFIEKSTDTFAGNLYTGTKGIETAVKKVLGQEIKEDDYELHYLEKASQKAREEASNGVEKVVLDIEGGIARMMPQIATGNPIAATVTGFANYGGGAYNEARQDGYTDEQATKYGVTIGTLEMALTQALGSLGKVYGKTKLGTMSQSVIDKVIPKIISNKHIRHVLAQAGSEGLEEFIQEYTGKIVKDTLLDEKGLLSSTWENVTDPELFADALYSGLIGSLTGATVDVPGEIAKSNYEKATGRNAETGYTQNEQTVIDTLVEEQTTELSKQKGIENTINEAITARETEQGGILSAKEKTALTEAIKAQIESGEIEVSDGKLTNKEISKIQEEVRKKLSEGKYGLSKIEDILTPTETAQIKELETALANTTETAQKEEIQARIEELKLSKLNSLKGMVNNNQFLNKAVYEAEMSNRAYSYDEAKVTDEYEKGTRESAKTHLSNNSEARKFVDVVSKLAKDRQKNYRFTNNQELIEQGDLVENTNLTQEEKNLIKNLEKQLENATTEQQKKNIQNQIDEIKYLDIGGFVRKTTDGKETVLLNVDSKQSLSAVLGHETKHLLEKNSLNKKFNKLLFDYAKSKGDYDTYKERIERLYDGIDNANLENELSAALTGDYLFTDSKFIETLLNDTNANTPKIIQKIKELIDDLVIRFKGTEQEKQLREVQKKFKELYKQKASTENVASKETKTQFSLTDNQGRTLTKEQQEHFKDSKVRDENGNLLTYYNGSGDFTVYDKNKMSDMSKWGKGIYLTKYEDIAHMYGGNVKELYVNITNPISQTEKTISFKQYNDLYKSLNDGENGYREEYDMYDNDLDLLWDMTNKGSWADFSEQIKEYTGKDGLIINDDTKAEDMAIAFDSNQVKNVDNTNPTSNPDIRYSLSDNQQARLKDTKVVDENNNPLIVYHGSPNANIDSFDIGQSGKNTMSGDYGIFFTNSKQFADDFSYERIETDSMFFDKKGARGKVYSAYLDMKQPLDFSKITPEDISNLYEYASALGQLDGEERFIENVSKWQEIGNHQLIKSVLDLKRIANETNYDGIIAKLDVKGSDLEYIVFEPSQIIRADADFSLSNPNEQTAPIGNYNVYGKDIKLEQAIAPLQEEIAELTETVQELKEQLAPVQEQVSEQVKEIEYTQPIKGDEFAPTPQNIVEQQRQNNFDNIDESSMPGEMEDYTPDESSKMTSSKSLFETRNYEELGSRKINAYQYDNPEVKPYFQAEARAMLGDLKASIKGERSYNDDLYYATNGEQGFYGTHRQTTDDIAELLDGLDGKYKLTYADIEKGLNAIINDEGAENNVASKRIEMYLDKRLREGYTAVDGVQIPANQEYINMMAVKEMNDYYNSLPITDDMAPVYNVENYVENVSNSEPVAPVKKLEKTTTRETEASKPEAITKGYQLTIDGKAEKVIDRTAYKEIAEILTEEPKTESDRNKRKLAIIKANFLDKGIVFEDLSLKEHNRELIAKWDYTLTSEARGQYAIGNGHNGLSKSLNDIRAEVENTGNTKDFYNYVYHKHNVDRMTLDKRFGVENKAVFGDSVTAEQSQAIVNQYEKTHPEFMDFAQDVYDYLNAEKQQLVDNGVISQEIADLWGKMYPHYVPTRRVTDTGIDVNVPLDTRRTGINAPIKKATGGNSDILPLFDTMAMRTLQTYRATAKNSFGVELKNTLGTTVESNQINVDELIDTLDSQEGLLQEGEKGKNPTFTVFENGEKVTFEITKDMYDALKPVSESSLLSKTSKILNTAGNIRRGVLTEFNPTFLLTNAIKDVQDVLLNSQHAAKTYAKMPEAFKQLTSKGYWYQEYVANGGERNSYFDNETNTFKTENKGLAKIVDLPPLSTISKLNNYIEMMPRLAEYIASREAGRSVEVSMLDAARVTTNFKAGGDVIKFFNRNGATFLSASVNGAMQQVRNVREAKANGVRGWVNLATKFAIAGIPALILNNLVWEDDDEYEELSDYVKQNYYVVGKTDNGTFIRIPKGRTVAVIQEGLNQMQNLITGNDEADLKTFIDLTINNLAPNNPLDNNILSPIIQVAKNEAWYGGDLLPTRLQNLPDAEQYDESTDMFSRWIGETFNVSPYKVNYLIDQYSGGVGDLLLPIMTPEATSDADSLGEHLLAPLKSKFTTSSTFNNQNVSDFYDTKEKLTIQANKSNATDEDVLKNKYMNSINAELSELYEQKREIQNSDLSKSEKYEQAKEIQEQINEITKNALSEYENVSEYSNYGAVGDREYYKKVNSEGRTEWTKVDDDEAEDLNNLGMSNNDKNTYFKTKTKISGITLNNKDTDVKKSKIIDAVLSSNLTDEQKAYLYGKHYSSDETLDKVTSSGISFNDYLTFQNDTLYMEDAEEKVKHLYNASMPSKTKEVLYETSVLSGFDNEDKYKDYKVAKAAGIDIDSWLSYKKQEFVADKDSSGDSISGSRKNKIVSYINSLNLTVPQKAILIRQSYPSFDDYNYQIISYVDGLNISYDEKKTILEGLDMKVDSNGNVFWD